MALHSPQGSEKEENAQFKSALSPPHFRGKHCWVLPATKTKMHQMVGAVPLHNSMLATVSLLTCSARPRLHRSTKKWTCVACRATRRNPLLATTETLDFSSVDRPTSAKLTPNAGPQE